MGKYILRAQASINHRSSRVVETLLSVYNELNDILSGQSVLCDGPLDIGRDGLERDVFLLPCTDDAPDGDSLARPVPGEAQSKSSSRSERGSKTPPRH